jgi:hypothetical protein
MRNVAADLLLGAAAGAAATYVMDQVTTVLYEREPKDVQERESAARGGKTAYEIAAERIARLFDKPIDEEQRKRVGSAIHWSLGVSSGVLYGALRHRFRSLRYGSGLLYGTAFFLLMDEGALTLLGLTPPPKEFPWQTHGRGLVGHLVLGGLIEAAFDVADAVVERA